MDLNNKRLQSLDQVFNSRWNARRNAIGEVERRKAHMNRMFNIPDKSARRNEMLYQNSVEGQVKSLNERMGALNQVNRMNKFK
jgi:hypothetical protein